LKTFGKGPGFTGPFFMGNKLFKGLKSLLCPCMPVYIASLFEKDSIRVETFEMTPRFRVDGMWWLKITLDRD